MSEVDVLVAFIAVSVVYRVLFEVFRQSNEKRCHLLTFLYIIATIASCYAIYQVFYSNPEKYYFAYFGGEGMAFFAPTLDEFIAYHLPLLTFLWVCPMVVCAGFIILTAYLHID